MSDLSNQAAIRAMANPIRRQILELLRAGELSVNGIVAQFDVARPAISRHLRVLREAKLVRFRSEHNVRHYSLDPGEMDRLRHDFDADFRDFWRPQGAVEDGQAASPCSQDMWVAREVRIATDLPVSCEQAYRYVTEEAVFRQWVGADASSTPEIGGLISATSAFGGKLVAEFLALVPGKLTVLRVVEPLDPEANLYTIAFEPLPEGGCTAVLRHFVRDENIARLVTMAWGETWKLLREFAERESSTGRA